MMLPGNIIQDILSRLDVKSLMRLRCVCKTWFNLISSSSFQDLHRSRSHHNLLFLFRSTSSSFHNRFFFYSFCSLDVTGSLGARFSVKVDDPIKLVLPSCSGLVCFATDTRIYVCNPATRQILALPVSPQRTSIAGFGFGYVDSIKGYKVVRLIHRPITHTIECSVFTITSDPKNSNSNSSSWTLLDEGCPYLVEQFSYPVFAKDCIFWKINRRSHRQLRRSNDYIVSFNVRDNKFSTLTHPADWRHISSHFTQLADLGGTLCMVEISTCSVVIWVLKDHHNCFWHKGGLIDIKGIDRRLVGEVKCLRNGEIIFSSLANILLFYDVNQKRFRQVTLPVRALDFGIYWESFFSLGPAALV
ncbi:putative F-box protein At1g19160 [Ricinus communis]|uniref:F-box domain-containing protein n=1 Tax=Ricinus communis TaxID=3988 RepID=B9S4H9_RICCO|nr:putative F-box protein At1g19160 [Ricinus communis]EEF41607.1 conserved hypothetical protein [Ricinus communis]|eukprot:XP_002520898.1 putative F-box protein At1g19160 [Ricinus communis]